MNETAKLQVKQNRVADHISTILLSPQRLYVPESSYKVRVRRMMWGRLTVIELPRGKGVVVGPVGEAAVVLLLPWLPDGKIGSIPFLGLRQGGGHGGAIQGKEGIKFCSAA